LLRYARLRPGRGFRAGPAALYYAQRLAVASSSRRAVARLVAAGIRLRHPARNGCAAPGLPAAAAGVVQRLRQEGCLALGTVLSGVALQKIRAYLAGRPVMAGDGRSFAAASPPAGVPLGAYALADVLRCPQLLALCNDPALLAIVRGYLGCEPTLSSIGLRWSYPAVPDSAAADTQRFHRDMDDWRALKLMVYLTDVDLDAGPHSFVVGTHRSAARLRARPYSREEVAGRWGERSIRSFIGPAGTAMVADTYGVHRGEVPRLRPRLMFLAQYSLLPIFAFEYRPLRLSPRPAVDPYINRLLIR
jgi:hypothetical protein